jgi:hypothetical protein
VKKKGRKHGRKGLRKKERTTGMDGRKAQRKKGGEMKEG